MIRNYLKIAFRSLAHKKSHTLINILGLSIGIAVCMMIFFVIQYQTSFDDFHTNKEHVYRVLTEYHQEDATAVSYGKDVPFPMPAALKTSFDQIEQVAAVFASHDDQVIVPQNNQTTQKTFKEQRGVLFTEPSFFRMFNFPLLEGSYESLEEPNNVLLTREIADKYFGDWKNAIGKTIKIQVGGYLFEHGTETLKVSGILETIPTNTDFQLKLVVAYGTGFTGELMANSADWEDRTNTDFGCYVMLPSNVSVNDFNQQLRAFSSKIKSPENTDSHIIQPLAAVHYDTQAGNYSNQTISRDQLNVLWLIAAFILLIACVNFVNLSTAQAVNRAKEVGVRKAMGSDRLQLQAQFMLETFLIVISAVVIASIVSYFALPFINQLLELSLSFNILSNPTIILFLLSITLLVTALAGFYPSVVLSGFSPTNALKSKLSSNTPKGLSLRRSLVIFQFVVAQMLIVATFVVVMQMDYFMNRPLGFDKDAVINVPFRVDSLRISRLDFLKQQLTTLNGVQGVSYGSNTPMENANDLWSAFKFNHSPKEGDFKVITKFVDEQYVPTYKLQLVAGRNLQPSGYTREFLVNETMMKNLGITNPEDILGKEISIWSDRIKCPVVGVLKDFNDRSLHNALAPLLMTTNNTMYSQAAVKIETKNISATLQSVKEAFEKAFPNFVYEYRFLDDKIGGFYKQENQMAQLFKIFAFLAIFLSCLGLYGLASFMAVQRIKEVGIRKVLGASVGSIVFLFSKEFMFLVLVAFIISSPIAWYYMNQWLQDYSYRIEINGWVFAVTGAGASFIAILTVSYQAIKAALMNPVKSLKTE